MLDFAYKNNKGHCDVCKMLVSKTKGTNDRFDLFTLVCNMDFKMSCDIAVIEVNKYEGDDLVSKETIRREIPSNKEMTKEKMEEMFTLCAGEMYKKFHELPGEQ